MEKKAYRICVYGIVQGVGFRPFVSRIADASGVTGSVANRGSYVEIFVCGNEAQILKFREKLESMAPERSAILKVTMHEIEQTDDRIAPFDTFEIIESEHEEGSIFVSPDIATCDKCKEELYDPDNRRYMHPFINCTACGPRLTILDAMPYDRVRTSMGEFPMCPTCEHEYTHSESRRYDAQPVCCNDCGPVVYLLDAKQENGGILVEGREAITRARQGIIDGQIIAIKGIGGFHLCCNAKDEAAVARLRQLKRRPMKPFAVMMRDLDTVRRECMIPSPEIEELLDGHQKPIVLLKKKEEMTLAPSVAPDNAKVGVMLPYAPVQMLLFDYNDGLTMTTDCFVMTSGNVSGAPICRTDEDARAELSSFCDLILSHNRKIRLRADDSVVDLYKGEPYMIRRSRGFAPLPVMTEEDLHGTVLGIGGELKNTFCIAKDQLLYESPYVGDMADLRTIRALKESVQRMGELLEAKPTMTICDMHPMYNTTKVAEEMGLPVVKLQHHYAHILSCMAENDEQDKVIGVSFDGTGYGLDGSIWGGEILVCDYQGFERAGSIVPFAQAGGDASAKEGWRIAASMLHSLYGDEAEEIAEVLDLCPGNQVKLIGKMAERGINTVKSTSAGRLFDAVSAMLGIRKNSTFEGEASMTLQFRAEEYRSWEPLADEIAEQMLDETPALWTWKQGEDRILLPTDELFRFLTDRKLCSKEMPKEIQGRLAFWFHAALARQIVSAVEKISEETGIRKVALSGGVFQNTLLLELTENYMEKTNQEIQVLRHHLIPPNDGGLALGQAAYGLHNIEKPEE